MEKISRELLHGAKRLLNISAFRVVQIPFDLQISLAETSWKVSACLSRPYPLETAVGIIPGIRCLHQHLLNG